MTVTSLLAQDGLTAVAELTRSTAHRDLASARAVQGTRLDDLLDEAAADGFDLDPRQLLHLRLLRIVSDPREQARLEAERWPRRAAAPPAWYAQTLEPPRAPADLVLAHVIRTVMLEHVLWSPGR